MSTIDATLAERGSRYGEFPNHAKITQDIKAAMANGRQWPFLADDMKECLEMVAHKIGRILNGDPQYIDSWTDIIGYTRLVEKRLLDMQPASEPLPRLGDEHDQKTFGALEPSDDLTDALVYVFGALPKISPVKPEPIAPANCEAESEAVSVAFDNAVARVGIDCVVSGLLNDAPVWADAQIAQIRKDVERHGRDAQMIVKSNELKARGLLTDGEDKAFMAVMELLGMKIA